MWFNRILKDSDNLLDQDYTDPHKIDAIKNFTFKTKAAPKDGMSVSHGNDLVKGDDGNFSVKHKTEVTAGCPAHDVKGKLTVNNKETAIRINHHIGRDPILAWNLRTTCQPQSNTWDLKVGVKHGGVQVGPIFPWTKVSYLCDIPNKGYSFSSNSLPPTARSTP